MNTIHADGGSPDTSAQRAARIFAMTLFLLMLAAAPVSRAALPEIRTAASVPPPQWSFGAFADGAWMRGLERHLKELSPVTYWLRGVYNEARFAAGILNVPRVHYGTYGWWYMTETVDAGPVPVERHREARRAFLGRLRALTDAAGIALLVLPAPDKSTIYPEFVVGELPAARRRIYDAILDDLRAMAIPHLDLRKLLATARREAPDQQLYYQRDSHWTAAATDLVAQEVAREVRERRWSDRLGPPVRFHVVPTQRPVGVPDLVRLLGMRSAIDNETQASAVLRPLLFGREYQFVEIDRDGSRERPAPEQPSAAVALCGSSYSDDCLRAALPRELGVLVDHRGVIGGGGSFRGLLKVIEAVRAGVLRPGLLVWEFVERDYVRGWNTPPRW